MIQPPKRLKVRPQWRGLPIPYIALIGDDGKPDFRVTDEQKRHSVIRNRWCQLCGQPLGRYCFFTGGLDAAKANHYFEPAAHLDCLIYAMQVCPFIVGRIEHADLDKVADAHPGITVKADETFSSVRNPFWIIKKAYGWRLVRTKAKTVLIVPLVLKETIPLHPESMTPADWQKVARELAQK